MAGSTRTAVAQAGALRCFLDCLRTPEDKALDFVCRIGGGARDRQLLRPTRLLAVYMLRHSAFRDPRSRSGSTCQIVRGCTAQDRGWEHGPLATP